MSVQMILQNYLTDWKISYIHHIYMATTLYECADAPSKHQNAWKIS